MATKNSNKIEKEDIISDEAIRNIERTIVSIRKLDSVLNSFCDKYGFSKKEIGKSIEKGL